MDNLDKYKSLLVCILCAIGFFLAAPIITTIVPVTTFVGERFEWAIKY